MPYVIGKIWGNLKIAIGIILLSLLLGPLIVAIKLQIGVVEAFFWKEICELPDYSEVIGKIMEEAERDYQEQYKKWQEEYKDVILGMNWRKTIMGAGVIMSAEAVGRHFLWNGLEKANKVHGVWKMIENYNNFIESDQTLRSLFPQISQWLVGMVQHDEKGIYFQSLNLVIGSLLRNYILVFINKLIIKCGYEEKIFFPTEIVLERARKMINEEPKRMEFEVIEKIAIERYVELKEMYWGYFIETLTAGYWSALIENFDLFI
jgi:hypothetical protein